MGLKETDRIGHLRAARGPNFPFLTNSITEESSEVVKTPVERQVFVSANFMILFVVV